MEKKLDDNYTRMLRAIFNKSWRPYPTKQQLYSHLPPITKIIKVRRTRHAGHYWSSRDGLLSDYSYVPFHIAEQKQGDQLKSTYSSSVWIRCVALRSCRRWWTIGRGGERGSDISLLRTWQDDDDDDKNWHAIKAKNDNCSFCSWMSKGISRPKLGATIFLSYRSEGEGAIPFPWLLHFPLIPALYCRVLSKKVSSIIIWVFGILDLGLNPGLPDSI